MVYRGAPTYPSFGQEYRFHDQMIVAPEEGLTVVVVGAPVCQNFDTFASMALSEIAHSLHSTRLALQFNGNHILHIYVSTARLSKELGGHGLVMCAWREDWVNPEKSKGISGFCRSSP